LRALIPSQPIYSTVCDDAKGTVTGVLSEYIQGTQLTDRHEDKEFKVGECKNLGKIQVGCLFVNDVDLRAANIIKKDTDLELCKIDGDWAFANIKNKSRFNQSILSEHFSKLPFAHDEKQSFNAYNWVGHKAGGALMPDHTLSYLTNIKKDKNFQVEVNQTILRVILLSDAIIKKIIETHATRILAEKHTLSKDKVIKIEESDAKIKNLLIHFLSGQRENFLSIAMKNKDFINYLLISGASELQKFSNELKEFKINEINVLTGEAKEIPAAFQEMFKNFLNLALVPYEEKIKNEITHLINITSLYDGYSLSKDAKRNILALSFDEKIHKDKALEERIAEIKESISNVKKSEEIGNMNRFFKLIKIKNASKTEIILTELEQDFKKILQ
jgi:hypothetical protein